MLAFYVKSVFFFGMGEHSSHISPRLMCAGVGGTSDGKSALNCTQNRSTGGGPIFLWQEKGHGSEDCGTLSVHHLLSQPPPRLLFLWLVSEFHWRNATLGDILWGGKQHLLWRPDCKSFLAAPLLAKARSSMSDPVFLYELVFLICDGPFCDSAGCPPGDLLGYTFFF